MNSVQQEIGLEFLHQISFNFHVKAQHGLLPNNTADCKISVKLRDIVHCVRKFPSFVT